MKLWLIKNKDWKPVAFSIAPTKNEALDDAYAFCRNRLGLYAGCSWPLSESALNALGYQLCEGTWHQGATP